MKHAYGRKALCLMLVFCMAAGALAGLTLSARAENLDAGTSKGTSSVYTVGGKNYALIRDTFYFPSAVPIREGGQDVLKDLPAVFYYSDGFFAEDPYAYNSHLATASMNMAMAAFYSNRGGTGPDADYSRKKDNIAWFLKSLDCEDIHFNKYYSMRPQEDSIGVVMAHRALETADGQPTGRILMPIAIRGANYEKEWVSNVTLGFEEENSGEAAGFSSAAQEVKREIDAYLQRTGLSQAVAEGKVDFWIAGYSRAGATTNLTARRLVDSYAPTRNSGNQVFAYCVEAPQGGMAYAQTYGNDYTCIHSVINKSDLVPRVAPSSMSFIRYGIDHYIPGSEAGAPGKKDDNRSYPVGPGDYNRVKKEMLKQLKAVNPSIAFSDSFQIYGFDSRQIKLSLATVAAASISPLPVVRWFGVVGQAINYVIQGKDAIIRKGSSMSMEAYLDEFFANLTAWTGLTRKSYVGGDANLQSAARDFVGIVFDSTKQQIEDFRKAVTDLWDNDQVGFKDLLGVFMYAFGEWHKPDFKQKDYYINKLVGWMSDSGAFDRLDLTKAEKDQMLNKDLPVLADFAMTWLSQDYRHDLHGTNGMTQLFTFMANQKNIMSNHYPEVNLAWLRAQDSLYQKETAAAAPGAPQAYPTDPGTAADPAQTGILFIDDTDKIYMKRGASLKDVLPDTLKAYFANGTTANVPIDWDTGAATWYSYDSFAHEWTPISPSERNRPQPVWVMVQGSYSDYGVSVNVYVPGLPEVSEPHASQMELTYDRPIFVELFTKTAGLEIRYTLDGSDPRSSPTAQVYTRPIPLGTENKKQEILLMAYAVSPDPTAWNDSDVMVFHYSFSQRADPTPRPIPVTGDPANPSLWLGLVLLGCLLLPALFLFRRSKGR